MIDNNRVQKVVFFGTPDFSTPSLQALIESDEFAVIAVVTQPDKPTGRKQILTASPVKKLAQHNNIPVLQPSTLSQKKEEGITFRDQLRDLQPDFCVVIAYGKIIPQAILDIAPDKFINIHGSVLPILRGASPIQYTILEGHPTGGVTIMVMDAGMDTGPILAIQEVSIELDETSQSLHDKLRMIGADILIPTLTAYVNGDIQPRAQNEAEATYCSLIAKTDGLIDWSSSPEHIDRQIRAFTPWPGAYTEQYGKRIQIIAAHVEGNHLVIDSVKPAGKQEMTYAEYIRGNQDAPLPPTA